MDISVAGVTFANNDGTKRQDILRKLGFGYRLAYLVQTTFENERAVEVRIGNELVGYIPRKHLSDPISYSVSLLAQIAYNDVSGNYYVILSPIEPPDGEEIAKTTAYCREHNITIPVISDKRVYQMLRYA